MGRSIVPAAAITLLLVLSLSSFGQTTDPTKTSKPGSISGKVTLKNKGMPGIVVSLRRSETFNPFETSLRAITDQEGNYKITDIAAGSYEVVATAPAYVLPDGTGGGRTIVISDGENVENINFSFVRGGVITGRITDSQSRPVIQQQVRLLRADPPNQANATNAPAINYQLASGVTDDRGIYRVFGLAAGRYKVAVGRGNETYSTFYSTSRATYKEVFYPDATELNKALVIEVGEGTEATNIDMTLGDAIESFDVQGRVVDGEKGDPFPNVRLYLQRLIGSNERTEFTNSFVTTNLRGEFTLEGLAPGKYGLFFVQEGVTEFRADNTTFEVIDSDISGITIKMIKGAAIAGVLVIDAEDKRGLPSLAKIQMHAYVQKTGPNIGLANTSRSSVGPDGSFRVAGLPGGTAFLNIGPSREISDLKGLFISRIERDGIVQPRGIEIKEAEQVSGIRVILEYGTAILRGIVNIENGSLPPGARLFVRISRPGDTPTNIRPPTVDERGRFIAEGLPAGTYEVTVSVAGASMKPRRPVKEQVVLQNDSVTEVTIKLDLSDGTKP